MPTGYTAAVGDGKVTEFADFAMECARARDLERRAEALAVLAGTVRRVFIR